jgi:membrane glycosyltransferase
MHVEGWAGHPLARGWRRLRRRGPAGRARPANDPRPLRWRRVVLLAFVLLGGFVGSAAMKQVLPHNGDTLAERALLVLFGLLFAWISAGFWTGVMGAWMLVRTRPRGDACRPEGAPRHVPPTAVVMPICNEHVPTVFGGLRATMESLLTSGPAQGFDFFVLSDTNRPDVLAAEHAAWTDLVEAMRDAHGAGAPRIHYRWRVRRTRRKAGNVADFARRWGGAYRYLVVLDADSLMTGACLRELVGRMEADPHAGILQTAPRACGHDTLHARILQFGARAYGPLFTAGMCFWQLGESHYWGHNAILRMRPFIEHCALPPLPGRGSLSGEVLSHDFVEAALMRRAGWHVWVLHDVAGSYEQVPPNLLAELQRDRRWCHGNLQNARLLFEPGLHAVHRSVFVTGVMAYASAPLWLGFLLLSTFLFTQHVHDVPIYFLEPYQLFPIWPVEHLRLVLTLFGLTGILLLAPKAISLLVWLTTRRAWCFGGVARLLGSAVVEFVHSLLLAPVRMLFHTQFVAAALTGWKLDWKSPPREDTQTTWREAVRRHGLHTLLALAWLAAIHASGAPFPWWLSPIIGGLLAAIPLSVFGSRASVGRAWKRAGLLLIPEELEPPRVLVDAQRHAAAFAASPVDFRGALRDPAQAARVRAATAPHAPAHGAKLAAQLTNAEAVSARGLEAIGTEGRLRLVNDRHALDAVARALVGAEPLRAAVATTARARAEAGEALRDAGSAAGDPPLPGIPFERRRRARRPAQAGAVRSGEVPIERRVGR